MSRTITSVGPDVTLIKPILNMVDHDVVGNGLEDVGLWMCIVLERVCTFHDAQKFPKDTKDLLAISIITGLWDVGGTNPVELSEHSSEESVGKEPS